MEEKYKYYSTQRPISIGTYPVNNNTDFYNYNERVFISEIDKNAWGELIYNEPLSDELLLEYELVESKEQKIFVKNLRHELRNIDSLKDDLKYMEEQEYENSERMTLTQSMLSSIEEHIIEMKTNWFDNRNKIEEQDFQFLVSEDSEFGALGNSYNVSTIEEAIDIYSKLIDEPRNINPGIKVTIKNTDYMLINGKIPQVVDSQDLSNYGDIIKNNKFIIKAIEKLSRFADNRLLAEYQSKGFEFNNIENYSDKYKHNLCEAIKKYSRYSDEVAVYLAKASARYINVDKAIKSIDDNIINAARNQSHNIEIINTFKDAINKEAGIIDFRNLRNKDYVVIDCKTTGIGEDDEIIEFAITDKNGNVLYENMFEPNKNISKEASEVNGLSDIDLKGKSSFGKEINAITTIIDNKDIIIFNKSFDTRLIKQSIDIHKEDVSNLDAINNYLDDKFTNNTYCAMQSYTEFKNDFKSTKLVDALNENGVQKTQSHRASDDCKDVVTLLDLCYSKLPEQIIEEPEMHESQELQLANKEFTSIDISELQSNIANYNGEEFVVDFDEDVSASIVLENHDVVIDISSGDFEGVGIIPKEEFISLNDDDFIDFIQDIYDNSMINLNNVQNLETVKKEENSLDIKEEQKENLVPEPEQPEQPIDKNTSSNDIQDDDNKNSNLSELGKNSMDLLERVKNGEKFNLPDYYEAVFNCVYDGVQKTLNSDNFKNWLLTSNAFYNRRLSCENALRVWSQRPDATYVLTSEQWKDFGRQPVSGSKGIKILRPVKASENSKGTLFNIIKKSLKNQVEKNGVGRYKLGMSNVFFTMNKSGLIGLEVNKKEYGIFSTDNECRKYIDKNILNKVIVRYSAINVFDIKDVNIPERLTFKDKTRFKVEDMIIKDGKPLKQRGEYVVRNTKERIDKFQPHLLTDIPEKDADKMKLLFDACTSISEKNGVPVKLSSSENDSILKGGADGYFSLKDKMIVIDQKLSPTERCSVLFHEMAHADLHGNLAELSNKMQGEKITNSMCEIQAEAIAFTVAKNFGIETNTSSFNYLAAHSKGFDLLELKKSLEVIYNESKELITEIGKELESRNLNLDLDLTYKEDTLLDVSDITKEYVEFANVQIDDNESAIKEIPSLMKKFKNDAEAIEILNMQIKDISNCRDAISTILKTVDELNNVKTREEQEEKINILIGSKDNIQNQRKHLDSLSNDFITITEKSKGGLKVAFDLNPLSTLNDMKSDYPKLSKLSENQLAYIATSDFINREYVKLLKTNPIEFVECVSNRAELINKVASKNGTFIEINFCEKWTDKPFFVPGTLCSPKIANNIVETCEKNVLTLKDDAQKRGEYFPYTKCRFTVYTPNNDGKLSSYTSRIDIGDGSQNNLKEFLNSEVTNKNKQIINKFNDALSDRADKRKIRIPGEEKQVEKADISPNESKTTLSRVKGNEKEKKDVHEHQHLERGGR